MLAAQRSRTLTHSRAASPCARAMRSGGLSTPREMRLGEYLCRTLGVLLQCPPATEQRAAPEASPGSKSSRISKIILNVPDQRVRSSIFSTMLLQTVVALCAVLACALSQTYQPTWPSINSRPLPSWYDEAKVRLSSSWARPQTHLASVWHLRPLGSLQRAGTSDLCAHWH